MFFIGIAVLIISLVIFVIQYFSLGSIFDSKVASELGGYISGFVGVFWTGAGAVLVYATFQEQKKLIVKQQFEASFFKLLDTYNNMLNSMQEKQEKSEPKFGKAYISQVWEKIKDGLKDIDLWVELSNTQNSSIPEINNLQKELEKFNSGYTIQSDIDDYLTNQEPTKFLHLITTDKSDEFHFAQFNYFFDKYKSILEPYCRFISNILKYVEEENKEKNARKKYLKILWSQMTEEELVILFYYAKGKESKDNSEFLTRLKKYNFLGDLSKDSFFKI